MHPRAVVGRPLLWRRGHMSRACGYVWYSCHTPHRRRRRSKNALKQQDEDAKAAHEQQIRLRGLSRALRAQAQRARERVGSTYRCAHPDIIALSHAVRSYGS